MMLLICQSFVSLHEITRAFIVSRFLISSKSSLTFLLSELNKGDGGPSTFSDDASTEIPSLREWCQRLTVASRERAAKTFLDTLKVFVQSILSYVKGLEGISDAEREALRIKWQTPVTPESDYESDDDNPYAWIHDTDGGYTRRPKSPPKDSKGNLIGICACLDSEFDVIVEDTVDDLKEKFKEGLHSKCAEGVQLVSYQCVQYPETHLSHRQQIRQWISAISLLRKSIGKPTVPVSRRQHQNPQNISILE